MIQNKRLTRREAEILHLVAHGLTDEQIATRLTISTRTVNWHVQNIFCALGASNRAHAVYLYYNIRPASKEDVSGAGV